MDYLVHYTLQPISETSFLIVFQAESHPNLSVKIGLITKHIQDKLGEFMMNITPSYNTILIDYLPHRIDPHAFQQQLLTCLTTAQKLPIVAHQLIELPVYYHPEVGPDLALYQQHGIELNEVIACHTEPTYTVGAIGFMPGFAFMTEVMPKLQRARHATPRLSLPKGSVAIAEQQTAVYPNDSPGGWNVIGNCPIALFTPQQAPLVPWEIGTQVRFYPIDRKEFLALGGQIIPQKFQ